MRSAPFILVGIFASAIYASAAVAQMSKDKTSKAMPATPSSQRSAEETCQSGILCGGTHFCCPSDTPNLCIKLTRNDPGGQVTAGWSGCVLPKTQEALKFWSDGCQPVWLACTGH
jgi:hypothetical protein